MGVDRKFFSYYPGPGNRSEHLFGDEALEVIKVSVLSHADAPGDRGFCVLLFLVYLPPSTSTQTRYSQMSIE